MVLAGPGSGKTKTLVHKIASLITIENNKPEYFLMLAHSRVAVADFKDKLKKLIGNQVYQVKIYTFHAFAISLLGKNIDDNGDLRQVLEKTTQLLNSKRISMPFFNMLVRKILPKLLNVSYICPVFAKVFNTLVIIAYCNNFLIFIIPHLLINSLNKTHY
jgi:ATP-dependent DNA helicase RecQ